MTKRIVSCSLAVAALWACAAPPPCDPTPVKKPVSMLKREIAVAIIGMDRPKVPLSGATVEACVKYWVDAMDREAPNRPDLFVLPEGIDFWQGFTRREMRDWVVGVRGDGVLRAMQAYARKRGAYVVFNSYRQRSDGRFANCTFAIDREGDVVAVYDKAYPTQWELECPHLTVVPGPGPVAVETDFGRLAFATCFDLNFRDMMEATAALKPDVVAFSSFYHGGFWQRAWALTCRAWFVGATVGNKSKDVWGPSGEGVFHCHDYFKTATVKVNTNYAVCHLDFNLGGLEKAVAKYGPRVTVREAGSVGCVTLCSNDPALKASEVVAEFGLETLSEYYSRSQRLRGGAIENKTRKGTKK